MTISVNKRAKIATAGNQQAANYWIACHGYGELVQYFIKKFNALNNEHFIIAPEGLNRFYLNGFTGRVGANWMTKEDRLQDITTNNAYLSQVYQSYQFQKKNFIAFGFSQGTETITRWLAHQNMVPKAIILWGNGLPDDTSPTCATLWKSTPIFLVIGSEDRFITPERLALKKAIFEQFNLTYELIEYKGEHKIYPEVLENLVQKLSKHFS